MQPGCRVCAFHTDPLEPLHEPHDSTLIVWDHRARRKTWFQRCKWGRMSMPGEGKEHIHCLLTRSSSRAWCLWPGQSHRSSQFSLVPGGRCEQPGPGGHTVETGKKPYQGQSICCQTARPLQDWPLDGGSWSCRCTSGKLSWHKELTSPSLSSHPLQEGASSGCRKVDPWWCQTPYSALGKRRKREAAVLLPSPWSLLQAQPTPICDRV